MPPAPPMFSMITCWPSTSERRGLRMRANTSSPEPAANATTMVIGRVGQVCAVTLPLPCKLAVSARPTSAINRPIWILLARMVGEPQNNSDGGALRELWDASDAMRDGPQPLRTADEDAGEKYQRAADPDLKRRRQERRIHVTIADIGDGDEFDRHHHHGEDGGQPEIRN